MLKEGTIKSCPYLKQKGIVLEKKIFTNHVARKKQGKKKTSKLEKRLCYTCRKKGHQCKDCPIGNNSTPNLSIDFHVTRQPKIATCASLQQFAGVSLQVVGHDEEMEE